MIRIVTYEQSLAARDPEIAAEWDYDKNDQTPRDVTPGSNKKVWWKCPGGHSYKAMINARTSGTKCPYCFGKATLTGFNDLATLRPDITEEWNYDKNDGVTPGDIRPSSNKKVWWRCKTCGNEYQATPGHRTASKQATGCPKCAAMERGRQHAQAKQGVDDFASAHPELIGEWDYERNFPVKPEDIKVQSNKKYHWICPNGHSYEASVAHRSAGRGCPVCSGKKIVTGINDLGTTHPDLVQDWDFEKNGEITPYNVSKGSEKKVWWKCHECGNEWQAAIYSRAAGTGCPKCGKEVQTSFPEQAVYYYVRKYFPDAINSYISAIGMELDIYIPSLAIAIEYDGAHFHSSDSRKAVEIQKNQTCLKTGISLIRIREDGLDEHEDCSVCISMQDRHSREELTNIIARVLTEISNEICPDIELERDAGEIYSQYIVREKELSLQALYPEIAKEWHLIKNGALTPDKVRVHSNKKVWWKCSICSKEWFADINHRTRNNEIGCPECGLKRGAKKQSQARAGVDDLATLRPDVAAEWDERNGNLTPIDVKCKSNRKVWWQCSKCKQEWEATVAHRTDGQGCPYCVGKRKQKPYQ